jgi:phosphotransferase system HPr (HPr) family protein
VVGTSGQGISLEATVVVRNKQGLHARPSSVLAENALRFKDTAISIRRGDLEVDAKSIMELLLLEARCGTELTLVATGPRAQEAIDTLRALFDREFDVKS